MHSCCILHSRARCGCNMQAPLSNDQAYQPRPQPKASQQIRQCMRSCRAQGHSTGQLSRFSALVAIVRRQADTARAGLGGTNPNGGVCWPGKEEGKKCPSAGLRGGPMQPQALWPATASSPRLQPHQPTGCARVCMRRRRASPMPVAAVLRGPSPPDLMLRAGSRCTRGGAPSRSRSNLSILVASGSFAAVEAAASPRAELARRIVCRRP